MKFLTTTRVGVVYDNHVEACCCYGLALKEKGNSHQETNIIARLVATLEVAYFVGELHTQV